MLTPIQKGVEPDKCVFTEVSMPSSGDELGMTKTGEVTNPKFHTNESEKLPAEISFRNGNKD